MKTPSPPKISSTSFFLTDEDSGASEEVTHWQASQYTKTTRHRTVRVEVTDISTHEARATTGR
jgi:hypothetical protein